MSGLVVTLDVAVLLAIVIVILLRRPVAPRTKADQTATAIVVLVFGIIVAPTEFGSWVLSTLGTLAGAVKGIHL
jgi:hypothetical protein